MEFEFTLPKSMMGFRLPDGGTFLLHEEDVKVLAHQLAMHLIIDHPQKVYLVKSDLHIEKARLLLEVYAKNKDDMAPELKLEYLKNILSLTMSDAGIEFETLQEAMDKKNTSSSIKKT